MLRVKGSSGMGGGRGVSLHPLPQHGAGTYMCMCICWIITASDHSIALHPCRSCASLEETPSPHLGFRLHAGQVLLVHCLHDRPPDAHARVYEPAGGSEGQRQQQGLG